jgi:hypothetical protein
MGAVVDAARLLEVELKTLSAQGFENLVHRLARREHAGAERVQLRPPDVGADTLVLYEHGRPLVFQAKHSQLRRLWISDCRESLQRARRRRPAAVTFVFPFSFTENQRARFRRELVVPNRRIRIEAWTLEDLRELLDRHRDVREAELDAPLRALLGGADIPAVLEQAQAGDDLLAAAAAGPLEHLGLQSSYDAAVLLARAGEHQRAANAFEALAGAIEDPAYDFVADVLRREAAMAAQEGAQRQQSGRLRLALADSALSRGETMAEVHAAHVQWFGGEELRWRADAMLARCQWPKAHDDALPELAAAYECAARDETVDADELCRWAVAYTDAALTLGAFGEALAVASDARERLGDAMPLDRIRLDLELDWLDAAGEQAAAGAEAWADVLASGYGRDPEMAGRIRQRQGVWYVRQSETDEAIRCFELAQGQWQEAEEAQEQFAEAFLAVEVAEGLAGRRRSIDALRRQTAGSLRGRRITPTVIADRCEAEGLRAHLAGDPIEARERLTTALAFHRRAGNLRGVIALAYQLARLHAAHDARADAVRWWVVAGNSDGAHSAGTGVPWNQLAPVARMHGPLWERSASFAALAGSDGLISDQDADALAPTLIGEAQGATSMYGPQPAARARAALAAVVCALTGDSLERALGVLRIEAQTENAPTCLEAVAGLIQAHEAGLSDEGVVVARVLLGPNGDRMAPNRAVAAICNSSPDARELVKQAALEEGAPRALALAAWMNLPDDDQRLRERCAARTVRTLDAIAQAAAERQQQRNLRFDVGVRHDDGGLIGRWATRDDRMRLARHFVEEFASPDSDEPSRTSALRALSHLSTALTPEAATELMESLLAAARGDSQPCRLTPDGADVELDESGRERRPSGRLRAAALATVARLASVAGMTPEAVKALAAEGLHSKRAVVRAAALGVYEELDELPLPMEVERFLTDGDATVRLSALRCLVKRDAEVLRSEAVVALTADPDVSVRMTLLERARARASGEAIMAALATDEHCLLRRMAAGE